VAFAVALAVGGLVGVISGLTGIGGGVLMVPFLYALYARLGVARADATVLAHATSLAVIVPAALRGLISFRGTNLVQWQSAIPIGITGAISATVTSRLIPGAPAGALRVAFGVFLLVISADLLLRTAPPAPRPHTGRRHLVMAALVGIPVGALAAALGVGGGVPATMAMLYILHTPFPSLAPTSLAFIIFTAAAGALGYLWQPTPALPFDWVAGYVDFGHGLPLALGAVACAPLGVRLNRRLPVVGLRRVFGAILLVLGVMLIWQNV
jgi:uncharacterized membrane protein YfcA